MNPTILNFNRTSYSTTYRPLQPWSLPDSIIYYITKNPSTPKYYQKMIQSCKYFFIKNPILIISNLFISKRKNALLAKLNGKYFDLKKLISNIWIIDKLFIDNLDLAKQNSVVSIISKIYRSNATKLSLWHQDISFNDLNFLAPKCDYICFNYVTVFDENVFAIGLEKLVDSLSNIKKFCWYLNNSHSTTVTSKTVQNLIKIPHFSRLKYFRLLNISESFDIDTFYDYIKKNKETKIRIDFSDPLPVGYKSRLQTIVNEITEAQNHDYKVPYLNFSGISSPLRLWRLYNES